MAIEISSEKFNELKNLGGISLVEKLLDKFLQTTPRLVADAKAALQSGDHAKIDYCVHTMKGSSLSLGISTMSDLLVDMNLRTKKNDTTNLAEDLAKLDDLLKELSEYRNRGFA